MRILIVDDEVPVRKYIEQMIRDCGKEYEIVASVNSGKAALEILERQRPDLIFADITMPKMTGLELLEKIKQKDPGIDVFMLTCHNDFEFARTAVKLQADNYILKDEINMPFMKNLLKTVQDKRERAVLPSLHRLESESYFIQLMDSEHTLVFDFYDLEKNKIFLKDKEFIAVSVTKTDENLQRIIPFRSPLLQNQEIFPYQDTNIILVANLSLEAGQGLRDQVQEMIGLLKNQVSGPVGFSSVYYKINMLRQAVQEAGERYNFEYYQKPRHRQEKQSTSTDQKIEMYRYVNTANNLVVEGKYQKLFVLLLEMLAFAVEKNIDVYLLKRSVSSILDSYQMQSKQETDQNRIMASQHVSELKQYLETLSGRLVIDNIQYSQAISDALTFIEKQYGNNITLSEVAGAVHLNPEYFSRRFKKETGVNFSEYILRVRMEAAKHLLLTTKKTITEIAGETGFNNDSYFSVTFKKVYGENPNELRKGK